MFIHDGGRFLQTQQIPAVAGFIVLGPPPFSARGLFLLAILGFVGITDINVVRVEVAAIPSIGSERAISSAIAQLNKLTVKKIQKLKQPAITLMIIGSSFILSSRVAKAQSQVSSTNSPFTAEKISKSAYPNIWQNGVGEGFNAGVQSVQLGLAAGYGVQMLGSRQSHDLILGDLAYGYTLGSVEGEGHWYRGNWELRMELFGGSQFAPVNATLEGITPHLRYYFMTGTRWVPFLDAGAGLTATTIGGPDLSDTFEFNLQATAGVRWFVRDNLALGIEARYLHISCAGLHSPNLGLNNAGGMVNITWFF